MISDTTDTNTQLLRPKDATDPAALDRISADRAALVRELISRPRAGHRALDRSDLAGEVTTRLVPSPPSQELLLPLPQRAPQAALAGAHAAAASRKPGLLATLLQALRVRGGR